MPNRFPFLSILKIRIMNIFPYILIVSAKKGKRKFFALLEKHHFFHQIAQYFCKKPSIICSSSKASDIFFVIAGEIQVRRLL